MTRPSSSIDLGRRPRQRGFSLVEMAVVLVVLGLLLGGLLMPLGQTLEQTRRSKAKAQLREVLDALYGFALAHRRLPCPADPAAPGYLPGQATPDAAGPCSRGHGFVPGRTLGLNGSFNEDGLLRDPWGNPLRYTVTGVTAFTTDIGSFALPADLVVRGRVGGPIVADGLPAVVYSQGRDWATSPTTPDQDENGMETTLTSALTGASYQIGREVDRMFVHRDYDDAAGTRFDDLVVWVSPNVLYARLVAATLW
jgi:prepilin-type N-terminal cleavage/methylation domain-containing protein